MEIQAYQDRIIAKIIETQKPSTIILTTQQEKSNKAIVLAVGEGKLSKDGSTLIKPLVNVNDVILFENDKAIETTINNNKVIILKEENIIAIL